jgi:hypothetical protein
VKVGFEDNPDKLLIYFLTINSTSHPLSQDKNDNKHGNQKLCEHFVHKMGISYDRLVIGID